MNDEIKELLAAREALPSPESILYGARFDMDRAKWERLWLAIENVVGRWRFATNEAKVETSANGLHVIPGRPAVDMRPPGMEPLGGPDDDDGEPGGPVEEIDFLLAHSTALRSVLIAQKALLDLAWRKPGDTFDPMQVALLGRTHADKGLAALDVLVREFMAQQEEESPVELAEWTQALKPEDRGMLANALRGLMHYGQQFGPESGVAIICKAVLYAVAAERQSIGGTVAPADETFRLFLDDLQTMQARELAADAQLLASATMRTLAAIIVHKKGERLAGWFQALSQAAQESNQA